MDQNEQQKLKQMMREKAEFRKVQREKDAAVEELNDYKHKGNRRQTAPVKVVKRVSNKLQSALFGREFQKLRKNNRQLKSNYNKAERKRNLTEEDLAKAQKKITEQQATITMLEGKLKQADPDQWIKLVSTAYANGDVIDCLEEIIQLKQKNNHDFNEALYHSMKEAAKEENEIKWFVYTKILSGLNVNEVPEFLLRGMEDQQTVSLAPVSSFRSCLTTRLRRRQLGEDLPEWQLDDKSTGYRFAKEHSFTVPQVNEQVFTLDSVPKQAGIVIKPHNGAGARGVYLLVNENRILDVKRSEVLSGWGELTANMREDLKLNWVHQDEWRTEQLYFIDDEQTEPARDLKFYSFYGKVALILEVKRFPEPTYCWWSPDGSRVHTGKYENKLMAGEGFSNEDLLKVEALSKKIPAPFCRIDFLKTSQGLVFGEVTPKPGNYDHFDDNTDQILGEYFLEAEGRLQRDLLQGKKFLEFR
ncbi:teichuronopeptide biosynthesis [Salipaludibacillus keqinensis]|uniref:Teichuronopeptide biosynthesis n=1 Tax=Salipaludibacillus keqinensis TaxID=2045207 RepID=A0A323TEP8_9BACI|nr:ATP-grasp fold amidoligase family protein [Salipaludibacillus keqinensis]PYZ92544.1 teichuronopeptide biosynthesis [Salipaludibacillus keqinensis]